MWSILFLSFKTRIFAQALNQLQSAIQEVAKREIKVAAMQPGLHQRSDWSQKPHIQKSSTNRWLCAFRFLGIVTSYDKHIFLWINHPP